MSRILPLRIIPCLQLIEESLVKTVKFRNPVYIGDPVNTVRIFNELEVDELCFIDIRASIENREPDFKILREIANECFMPLIYGGGITTLDDARKVLSIGFEKILINTAAYKITDLIKRLSSYFGSQAIVASIDVRKNIFGKYQVYINDGTTRIDCDPVVWAQNLEAQGAGELMVTSIDREGTWSGYDIELNKKICQSVSIPVIAHGGCGNSSHLFEVHRLAGVSAAASGSMVVYQKKGKGVLVNFPDREELEKFFNSH